MQQRDTRSRFIRVDVRVKADPKRVQAAVNRGKVKSLRAAGALIYRIARNSISFRKSRDIHSKPGKPPFTHNRGLKKAISFNVVESTLVVGPSRTGIGLIGNIHEFGGTVRRSMKERKYRKNNWKLEPGGHGPIRVSGGKVAIGKLGTSRQVYRARILSFAALVAYGIRQEEAQKIARSLGGPEKQERTYPARPFMGPALGIARPQLPEFWNNSIRE